MPQKVNIDKPIEKYRVKIPKVPGGGEQDDVVLSINGKTISIKRGVEVELTKPFFESLERWMRANDYNDDYIAEVSSR